MALALLLARPEVDARWEHHPAHFWLVLATALASVGLALVSSHATRGDARLTLVSLTFLASAGFLGLHAPATPGILLAGKNAGFVVATPVGLLLGAFFAATSSLPSGEPSRSRGSRRSTIRAEETASGTLAAAAAVGVLL